MRNPLVLGAVVLGILAVVVTFMYFRKKAVVPQGPPRKATYVVAKEPLLPRVPVSQDMLEVVTVEGVQDATYLRDVSAIVGKSVSRPIAVGEKIPVDAVSTSVTTFPVPEGLRAIPLFFDPKLTTAGLLNVGDRVDVLVVYTGAGAGATDAVARTVAQNCEVISIDSPGAVPLGEGEGKGKGKSETPRQPGQGAVKEEMVRVVLAATPEDAVKITAATERGDIRLVIRNPRDAIHARVEEEWEHPHRIHPHYPNPAPPSPENLRGAAVAGGGAPAKRPVGGKAPERMVKLPRPPLTAGQVPPALPSPPSAAPEKTVRVIKGSQAETVTVPE